MSQHDEEMFYVTMYQRCVPATWIISPSLMWRLFLWQEKEELIHSEVLLCPTAWVCIMFSVSSCFWVQVVHTRISSVHCGRQESNEVHSYWEWNGLNDFMWNEFTSNIFHILSPTVFFIVMIFEAACTQIISRVNKTLWKYILVLLVCPRDSTRIWLF